MVVLGLKGNVVLSVDSRMKSGHRPDFQLVEPEAIVVDSELAPSDELKSTLPDRLGNRGRLT